MIGSCGCFDLEIETIDELHHQVGVTAFVHCEIVDLDKIRVAELDGDFGLTKKPRLQNLVFGEVGAHDLDHPDLFEQTVTDLVDGPHSAFPNLLENLVLAFQSGERHGQDFGLLCVR